MALVSHRAESGRQWCASKCSLLGGGRATAPALSSPAASPSVRAAATVQADPVHPALTSATASLAWFAIAQGEVDGLQTALGGVTLFSLLIRLFFIPDSLRLPFSSQHWVFTFPLAMLGNVGIRWAAGAAFDGWETVTWIVLATSTASIQAILCGTLHQAVRGFTYRAVGHRAWLVARAPHTRVHTP